MRRYWPLLRKYYLTPLRHRVSRAAVPYNSARFWSSWHRLTDDTQPMTMMGPHVEPWRAALFYTQIEYFILLAAARWNLTTNFQVLDVGTGTGYWLAFWQRHFTAKVYGVDISPLAVERLIARGYRALVGDVCDLTAVVDRGSVDVVSAIGVLYHVVSDTDWRRALHEIAAVLPVGGYALISGEFGQFTRDVQFHTRDDFATWAEMSGRGLVNKRLRSRAQWRRALRAAGLAVVRIQRGPRGYLGMPERNLLTVQKL